MAEIWESKKHEQSDDHAGFELASTLAKMIKKREDEQ